MGLAFEMSSQPFEPPFKNKKIQVNSKCDEDSDEAITEETSQMKKSDRHWAEFENLISKGAPTGFKLEEGLIWLHEPKAILCIASL